MLKFLFIAIHKDGTIVNQTQADVSVKDPKRSAFFDVDVDNLDVFTLVSEETDSIFTVDLTNGFFQVNGSEWFATHPETEELSNCRVVYFRTRIETFTIGGDTAGTTIFKLGWQANRKDGSNVTSPILEIH